MIQEIIDHLDLELRRISGGYDVMFELGERLRKLALLRWGSALDRRD